MSRRPPPPALLDRRLIAAELRPGDRIEIAGYLRTVRHVRSDRGRRHLVLESGDTLVAPALHVYRVRRPAHRDDDTTRQAATRSAPRSPASAARP